MPHATQHPALAPATPPTKTLAAPNGKVQSDSFMSVHERKDLQQAHALNPLDPFEVDGTPVNECSTAAPSEHDLEELRSTLIEARKTMYAAMKRYSDLHWIGELLYELPSSPQVYAVSEAPVEGSDHPAQETLAKAPRPPPPKPEPLSRDGFIKLLEDEGLTWLLEQLDTLPVLDDYAVVATDDPKKKRCRVGKPIGKILRKDQTDDLKRRLCCLHATEGGFDNQMKIKKGKKPWKCWPINADEPVLGDDEDEDEVGE
ncbi:hypothetical protein J4E90_004588 [Alternaria incomplexa]|uniref:uncharacterized protein n=1 Tax=Alternaria incomplexa TaxID=1187928 RepID=UPI00221F6639|nr:uncharacterized protein J4E90_004588 [Alternaria incomplexa]KAI4914557.1 hypothetical protein J4E90_004588 [Alternaria incomplexa]